MRRTWTFAVSGLLALMPAVHDRPAEEDLIELLRADLRATKVEIVSAAMRLREDEAKVFWPIYGDYEVELGRLSDRRMAMIQSYADEQEKMTDERAAELAAEWFRLQEDRTKLRKKYYRKVEKALSSGIAARFIQVENQVSLLIDLQISEELPLIHTSGGDS